MNFNVTMMGSLDFKRWIFGFGFGFGFENSLITLECTLYTFYYCIKTLDTHYYIDIYKTYNYLKMSVSGKRLFFIMGGPASGKGSQCSRYA